MSAPTKPPSSTGAAGTASASARAPKAPREGVSNPHKNESGSDAAVRKVGRAFIITFYGALRAIKLYPVENAAVQKSLDDLTQSSRMLLHQEKELEFRASGEFIFINQTRLRLDVDNYTSFSNLLSLFRANGVGSLRVMEGVTAREWLVLLSLLQAPGNEGPEERYFQLAGKLEQAKVLSFEFGPPVDAGLDAELKEQVKEAAKRTYRQSVAVTKECINSVRLGKAPNVKKLKRVVQGIVDAILNDETSLFGLTTIRDYDEYTFTHSVNVCIFSVALGRRLGLGKLQLYDLGLAALFHDIGKARVPSDVLNKADGLTEEEWRQITNHPWL
ncbi:MAG TPA: HD domain-containing phosphohydrolase, partial [Gemmatimonadaceae bacterium]|nr:HD domain-containing phosphohydrolase [Gemmatimonadaceae bacterium]